MDITLNAVAYRNGVPYQTTLELTKRADGTWRAKNFDSVLRGTAQSRDTYKAELADRAKLSRQEIAELAGKYDPHNMTQDQYDAFLDDLIEKGALSRFDAMQLGHHGWRILDINPETFAAGGIGCGSAYAVSAGDSENGPIQSLEDVDGDLIRWLEHMLAQQDHGNAEGSRPKKESLNILSDIIKRMRAV